MDPCGVTFPRTINGQVEVQPPKQTGLPPRRAGPEKPLMSLITTGQDGSDVDPTSVDLISLGSNLMGSRPTVVTELPGKASHPEKAKKL